MHPLMRYMGEPVEIMTRDGGVQRGVITGVDPPTGIFLATAFGIRFIPFIIIIAAFSIRFRIRIF